MSSQDGHTSDGRSASLFGEQPKAVVARSLVRELNERCLELMVHLAKSDFTPVPTAVSVNRNLWCGLDATARGRISEHPVLLLDVYFANSAWWRWAANPRCLERKGSVAAQLPLKIASELMRETTTLAWTIARMDERLCTILFGMTPPVAHLFASFGPLDVERIAARHVRHVRLRYDDHPSFWRAHLRISGSRPMPPLVTLEAQHADSPQRNLF